MSAAAEIAAPREKVIEVLVYGDPVADIRVLQDRSRLHAILKGGQFVKDAL